MDAITFIAEERIRKAQEEGAFDNLPNMGKPIDLGAEELVPPDLRMAYTLLKNSGYFEENQVLGNDLTLRNCLPKAETDAYVAGLRLEIGIKKAGKPRQSESFDSYYGALCSRLIKS